MVISDADILMSNFRLPVAAKIKDRQGPGLCGPQIKVSRRREAF